MIALLTGLLTCARFVKPSLIAFLRRLTRAKTDLTPMPYLMMFHRPPCSAPVDPFTDFPNPRNFFAASPAALAMPLRPLIMWLPAIAPRCPAVRRAATPSRLIACTGCWKAIPAFAANRVAAFAAENNAFSRIPESVDIWDHRASAIPEGETAVSTSPCMPCSRPSKLSSACV